MKLSPKSKRLLAFIKRQDNPGNWPLATLPPSPRRATTVVKHCLLLCLDPVVTLPPPFPLYAFAIPA
ncbi:unnamed protein product [Lasius platythorax]|uniref:Uncharacterized protein n=1 Tax=Lasius platythorax TaxID=488582 RepID=A0AAV2P8R0_9HYME